MPGVLQKVLQSFTEIYGNTKQKQYTGLSVDNDNVLTNNTLTNT